jgi:excisionase family DNA binding protein
VDIARTVAIMRTYLTRREAADTARVSTKTIDRWIKAGLPVSRPGRRVLIDMDDLLEFVARPFRPAA